MRGHISRRDVEATKAAGFKDKRSHITAASHKGPAQEFLFGEDMKFQRNAILFIQDAICQKCGIRVSGNWEMHHIKSRGRGGDDSLSNLQVLCVPCHRGPSGKHA